MKTSKQAFRSIQSVRPTQRAVILRRLMDLGEQGATSDEMEQLLQWPHQTVSARLNELAADNSAIVTATRRRTRSRRMARVYRASGV